MILTLVNSPYEPNNMQLSALHKIVQGNKNFFVIGPTGSGKTEVARYALGDAQINAKSIIYCSPLIALSREKEQQFKEMDCEVIKWTGEDKYKFEDVIEVDAITTTPEKLQAILQKPDKAKAILENVSWIVFDEAHLMGETSRGIHVEGVIIALILLYPKIRIIGLSATFDNVDEIAERLGFEVIKYKGERPVPLETKIEVVKSIYEISSENSLTFIEAIEKQYDDKIDILESYGEWGQVKTLVLCSARHRTVKVAKEIARFIAPPDVLEIRVSELGNYGVATHHAGMDKEIREMTEHLFKDGNIHTIVCTTTITQGVDYPCRRIFCFDSAYWDGNLSEETPYTIFNVHQILGRSGRQGKDKSGLGVIITSSEFEEYYRKCLDPNTKIIIESQIEEKLKTQILTWVIMGINKPSDIRKAAMELGEVKNFAAFSQMFQDKLLKSVGDIVEPSPLANIAAQYFLDPGVVKYLYRAIMDLEAMKNPTMQHIFNKIFNNKEFTDGIAVRRNKTDKALRTIGHAEGIGKPKLQKAYTMLFKNDYINNTKIPSEIRKKLTYISNSDLYKLKQQAKRIISAASKLSYKKPIGKKIHELSELIEIGSIDPIISKFKKYHGIGTITAKELINKGFTSMKIIKKVGINKVRNACGTRVANLIMKVLDDNTQTTLEF